MCVFYVCMYIHIHSYIHTGEANGIYILCMYVRTACTTARYSSSLACSLCSEITLRYPSARGKLKNKMALRITLALLSFYVSLCLFMSLAVPLSPSKTFSRTQAISTPPNPPPTCLNTTTQTNHRQTPHHTKTCRAWEGTECAVIVCAMERSLAGICCRTELLILSHARPLMLLLLHLQPYMLLPSLSLPS